MTQKTFRYLIAAGAAALTLAGSAAAQSVPGTPPARNAPNPRAPSTTHPTPAPAPPAAQPPASQPSGPTAATTPGANGQLSAQDLLAKLGPLHEGNLDFIEAGKLATERGANPQVKEAGKKMQADFQKLDDQLKALASERGQKISESAPSKSSRDQFLAPLHSSTGEQFDRDFVTGAIERLQYFVTGSKELRDSTPGKDARVKKWIDDAENVAEDNLNHVRTAKVALDKSRGQAKK